MLPLKSPLLPPPRQDVHNVILKKMNANSLSNLRATCTELNKDQEITKMQEDAQRAEAIEALGSLSIPGESIPEVVEKLDEYKNVLNEKFSNENIKDFTGLQEIEGICRRILGKESDSIGETVLQHTSPLMQAGSTYEEAMPVARAKFFVPLCINAIKECMVQQKVVLAESYLPQNPSVKVYFDSLHEANCNNALSETSNYEEANNVLKTRHMQENVAAGFSSQFNKIHAFLEERQKSDVERVRQQFLNL